MQSDPQRNNTTVHPQKTPEALTTWWRAPLARDGFYCYRVQVVSSKRTEETFLFSFRIDGTDQVHTVDLHLSNEVIWPERPSTAQLAAEGEFGFLLIDPKWLARELDGPLPLNGGKWPISAGDELVALAEKVAAYPELAAEAAVHLQKLLASKGSGAK